jgi:hypothetical protein
MFLQKEKHSEKTPHKSNQAYSVVWGHHWSGYTEHQSPLTNVLVRDMGNLRISEAHSLENSSIPLLSNIPEHVLEPTTASSLCLLVGADDHGLPPFI